MFFFFPGNVLSWCQLQFGIISQFAVLLSFVLIMELAAAVAAYALQDGIKDLLAEKINLTMHQYEKNEEATFAIDFMQSRVRHLIIPVNLCNRQMICRSRREMCIKFKFKFLIARNKYIKYFRFKLSMNVT